MVLILWDFLRFLVLWGEWGVNHQRRMPASDRMLLSPICFCLLPLNYFRILKEGCVVVHGLVALWLIL